jgi:hypothetical protein
MQLSIIKFYYSVVQILLNMFRALPCPSSGVCQTAIAASGFRMDVEVEVFSAVVDQPRQVINLRNCCIWFIDSFECMMMHGLANPKFLCSIYFMGSFRCTAFRYDLHLSLL